MGCIIGYHPGGIEEVSLVNRCSFTTGGEIKLASLPCSRKSASGPG